MRGGRPNLAWRTLGALAERGSRLPALALAAGLLAAPGLPGRSRPAPVPLNPPEPPRAVLAGEVEVDTASPQIAQIEDILAKRAPGLGLTLRGQLARALVEESAEAEIDPLLALAVMRVESEFDEDAQSERGARGLMQVRPGTLAFLAKREGLKIPVQEIYEDPVLSTRLAVRYLGHLQKAFHGDVDRALMAYNAGPHRLSTALKDGDVDRFQVYPRAVRRAYRRLRALPPADELTVAERTSAGLRAIASE